MTSLIHNIKQTISEHGFTFRRGGGITSWYSRRYGTVKIGLAIHSNNYGFVTILMDGLNSNTNASMRLTCTEHKNFMDNPGGMYKIMDAGLD